jgi:hypothetical protein
MVLKPAAVVVAWSAVHPSEELPPIGWRVPSGVSNQAPSSWDAFTQKDWSKK